MKHGTPCRSQPEHAIPWYRQENVKVGPYIRSRTRVWLRETKSVKKAYQGALVHFYIWCQGSCKRASSKQHNHHCHHRHHCIIGIIGIIINSIIGIICIIGIIGQLSQAAAITTEAKHFKQWSLSSVDVIIVIFHLLSFLLWLLIISLLSLFAIMQWTNEIIKKNRVGVKEQQYVGEWCWCFCYCHCCCLWPLITSNNIISLMFHSNSMG